MDANEVDLQAVIRRNVKTLMAVQGIDTARVLAHLMGRPENTVARQLKGTRAFQLGDLPDLATALGSTPDRLLGDVASLVGAVAPVSAISGRRTGSANTISRGQLARTTRELNAQYVYEKDASVTSISAHLARRQGLTNVARTARTQSNESTACG